MKRAIFVFIFLILAVIFFSLKRKTNDLDVIPLPGTKYFDTLAFSFRNSKNSITVVMFEFFLTDGEGKGPDSLHALLINAAKRGVKVRVILEGGEKHLGNKFKKRLEKTAKKLSEAGVTVYLEKRGITTHTKMVIVDGREVFLGSANWTYYGLNKNNESN